MTIRASLYVNVIPTVLSAGGSSLDMNGLILTRNTRVPASQILSFPNDGVSVSNYFGPSAAEVEIATVYFDGFENSTQKPERILFTRYTPTAAAAYLRGGPINSLTIPQIKALAGTLTIVIDGYSYTSASIDLSASTSYSSAAAIIETELNGTLPTGASFTGAIAPGTASVTGGISGNVLTVTAVGSGSLAVGALITGTGVAAGTQITAQLSGDDGDVGTYAVSIYQSVDPGTTIAATYGTLTVSAVASGTLSPGQVITGGTVDAGTQITAYGTGEGLTGTYIVDLTQTETSGALTSTGPELDVSYDSVSGGLVITSGFPSGDSTVAYPTGTLAVPLFLTAATGAILSQGAPASTPGGFMANVIDQYQNWGTFMLVDDPDAGNGSEQKMLFAQWTSGTQDRFAYVQMDTDPAPRLSASATSSFGWRLAQGSYTGTCPISVASDQRYDAFVCGAAASIDFEATNGRISFAFKGQGGLVPDVTSTVAATNLIANGYNFYGAVATANNDFRWFSPGLVSGQYQWLDSYINQIWLNNALQLALMSLLESVNSIPYNEDGYELMVAACLDPINAALNFGSIRAGVPLSASQAAQVNAAAGAQVSDTLATQGYYMQVLAASPIVRQARGSPPSRLWYMDGQSVQKIDLVSTLVQ